MEVKRNKGSYMNIDEDIAFEGVLLHELCSSLATFIATIALFRQALPE